ncbi:MAG: response regulator [FCB group bacterium]|jgi:CheY-like chemotaxis protein/anti-sigma regulatory factor (Ser/Thr protein kinase)
MNKILVIDDAEFILDSTSTLLQFEGYEVETALDGLEGVEKAFKYKPDIILCDISMPGLDGYGVLEKIRSSPITATTPFIFLTAFSEKKNMRAGMEKGADDYIVKPYTRSEILAAIDAQKNKHKAIEKQFQEKVDEVGRNVAYALPHEFRTVLNEVINTAKYLNSSADIIKSDEIQELSNDIITSSQRLVDITENFLFYIGIEALMTNPERRRQLRNYRTEEPEAIIEDIAALLAYKHERRDDFIYKGNANGIFVEMSSESFHKIVDELTDNAFSFSEKGKKIDIKTWVENENLHIQVTDQGRGMSKNQISNIAALNQFDRTLYEQQGAGFGLIIAKRLTELHDGDFKIHSQEGKGTQITISLPCKSMID